MPHAVGSLATGLQVLILCGPGSSFSTFNSNPDENPKALLPIANRPMVWYPMDFCYRSGLTDITLICPHSSEEAIKAALGINPYLTSLPNPSPRVVAPEGLDQNMGTAEILRLPEIQNLITSDFVILPCDLVCELAGEEILQAWMVKAARSIPLSLDRKSPARPYGGGLGVWYETRTAIPVKGLETDFIMAAPFQTSTDLAASAKGSLATKLTKLVFSMPTVTLKELVDEESDRDVRSAVIQQHSQVQTFTTHRDAHIYVFPHWVLDFVNENEEWESIGEDVVGWWTKASWQAGLSETLGIKDILEKSGSGTVRHEQRNESASPPVLPHDRSSKLDELHEGMDGDGAIDKLTSKRKTAMPPFLAYIQPSGPAEPLIRRVDTAQLLLSVSLQLAKLPSLEEAGAQPISPFTHPHKVAYPEGVKPRTTITKPDSLLGENVTVSEKTSIKESVIGANCQIHEGAKLSQCLLMDGVVVGKGCKLTKCILGKRSEIGEGCTLTDCEVQENLLVEPKTEEKEAKLRSSAGYEATDAELQEVLADEVELEVALDY